MQWQLFIVGSMSTVIGTLGLIILKSISDSVKTAGDSVKELNIKVAIVIERIEYHDERIKKLEENYKVVK